MVKNFHFEHFKDFFDFHLKESTHRGLGRPKQSLEQLAKKLGYSSPSSLSMIATGQRLPSAALLDALFEEWKISPAERERIRLRVEMERRSRKGADMSAVAARLNQITPYHQIDIKNYNLIRDWYVMVVKILANCPDFSADPEFICRKLRRKISPAQARRAVTLLQEAGMLTEDPVSKKLVVTEPLTETAHDISSDAIRENHKGTIGLALEALEEQKVEQRQFNSLALQFRIEDLPRAKTKILNFVKEFYQEFHSDQSNHVHQLAVQFFELSNGGDKNDA